MAINLQKQSEPSAPREPTGSSPSPSAERSGIGIDLSASQDLGTWGGIDVEAEAKVSVDIETEIRSQGLSFNTDPNTGSMSLGAGLGSAKGKLGGNIGVELGVDDEGNVEITGARGAISIAGFGGNIEVNRDGSGSLGAEIGGFGVEVSRDENGKPSLTLSYGFGPGEVSITFSPNEEKEVPAPTPPPPTPTPTNIPLVLPDYPQHPKRMDCCEKVEEIYKFLGIAKVKKRKFKVAKQFLAPGGTGTEDCEDYYQIAQALFRMLANGLIINPKSKPLGSEWQNANATAWASSMYEMMAETMSDGNTSQRFEIATMMQLVQIMSAVAENSRKVEFIVDGLGFEPDLDKEEIPVCFTIYEKHKGFGKFDPKKINTNNIKTDEQVEAVLGKMLNASKVPIVKWQLKPGEISIKEALNG